MNVSRSSNRLWFWFAISSVAVLVVLAVSPVKDYFREYRHYQNEYREMLVSSAGSAKELNEAQGESVRIRQILIPGLGDRVDRCVSCHLGIENDAMADVQQPYRRHPQVAHVPNDVAQFGCVSCHRGQGRATTREAAHGDTQDWPSPILPTKYIEASCGSCHESPSVPEATQLTRGRALVNREGCPACHEMKGYETWTGDGPRLDGLAQKTTSTWLHQWLTSPRELLPSTRMPAFRLTADEVEALVAYLWAQPPLREIEETGVGGGDYDRGKKVFRTARCISCHTVEGRGNGIATELVTVGSKVDAEWLFAFLADPHAFQPETDMPQYAFARQDLLDIVAYMSEEFIDLDRDFVDEKEYRPSTRLIEEGDALYQKYGCGGCHRLGEHGGMKVGPSLLGIGDRDVAFLDFGERTDLPETLPAWLNEKVADPGSFREGLKMPDFGFDDEEREAVVVALLSQTGEEIPDEYRVPWDEPRYDPPGRFGKLVDRYRCMSCHQIQGAGGDIATAPLEFEGSKVTTEWIKQYLLLPTTVRPILTDRMIPLGMSEEEAGFMAEFMTNVYVDDSIPLEIFPDGVRPERAERGRKLFHERHGCQSCHQVEGSGGYVGPPLDDSPRKLRSGWIAWWLQGPQRWRADVRCPDYALDPVDAEDVAAYLVSLGNPEATDGE